VRIFLPTRGKNCPVTAADGTEGAMCNEQRRRVALGQIREDWSQTRIPLVFPEGLPNLEPLDSIRITDRNAILRAAAAGGAAAELVVRRWSWPGPGGKPVYNYRADGREFPRGRCLIVADGFYEFTAPADPGKKRKDKWLFTLAGEPWFCIAGLWHADPKVGEAYTMLTCPPGPDVAPYHDRQVVVLGPSDWGRWLDPAVPAAELTRPLPAGALEVEQVG
jgi:putative SOS response-associated peptidase YedK